MKKQDESIQKDDSLEGVDHHTEVHIVEKKGTTLINSDSKKAEKNSLYLFTYVNQHRKRIALFALVVIAFFAVILAVLLNQNDINEVKEENVAVRVEDTKINLDKYTELRQQAIRRGIEAEEFNDLLVNVLKTTVVAEELGIQVTDDDIRQFFVATIFPGFGESEIEYEWLEEEWVNMYMRYQVINQKIEDQIGYRGAVFPFIYSRYMEVPIGGPLELTGNQDAIDADKEYAREQAEQAKKNMEANSSRETAEEIIDTIIKDELFSAFGYQATLFGYDISVPLERAVDNESILEKVISIDETGVTDIFSLEMAFGLDEGTQEIEDAAYYFIWIESLPSINIQDEFREAFDNVDVFINPNIRNGEDNDS